VAYGFAGVDQDGRIFERWLTYAAFDNGTLYLFGTFYTSGMSESFPSDEDLLRFEPYLRQILAGLRLPVSDDWNSPGAELLSGPRLVVHHCDEGQITLLDLETGVATAVSLPDRVGSGAHLGSVRFSPDGSRIAFAAMTGGIGLIEETQGYRVCAAVRVRYNCARG
jgi:hypothetical protein